MSVRKRIEREFSSKVYPNTKDPMVALKLAHGVDEFRSTYLGKFFPWLVNGQGMPGVESYGTYDPNQPEICVGNFPKFTRLQLERIVERHAPEMRAAGRRFFLTTPWRKRVKLLTMISRVAKERFWLLVAAKMYETGQSVAEAIGETDEEVDFPLAAAMYLEEFHRDLLVPSPRSAGDINAKRYVPHGVFLNAGPFNFPGAIPMDMAVKALAMGNAFVEKSSPKSSLSGYLVWETIKIAFERMGIPWEGVVNYAPGDADVVNAWLASPHIAGLSFTGSSTVLSAIKRTHGELLRFGWAGRAPLVTGSAETSGVNVFIVCPDADPVYAAHEYVKAFIGRSGQKCSSARIAMVYADLHHAFIDATKKRLDEIRYGDVKNGADLGAMITGADREKLRGQIEELERAGLVRTVYEKEIRGVGHDFPPTVLQAIVSLQFGREGVRTVMNTEFFGPASTVVGFNRLEEVEEMCALSDFALTGSVFTDSTDTLRAVLNFLPAGNQYWNRKCTGALVETECFGGLRSASSPVGIKGKNALALFGSQATFSGFYPKNATEEGRRAYRKVLRSEGFVLSKW